MRSHVLAITESIAITISKPVELAKYGPDSNTHLFAKHLSERIAVIIPEFESDLRPVIIPILVAFSVA